MEIKYKHIFLTYYCINYIVSFAIPFSNNLDLLIINIFKSIMLDSFKKWSKDDDLPPIVDEIGFLNIKILINGIKFIRVLKIF